MDSSDLRPQPHEAKPSDFERKLAVGAPVQFQLNDGWWEVRVVSVKKGRAGFTVVSVKKGRAGFTVGSHLYAERHETTVAKLRPDWEWHGNHWVEGSSRKRFDKKAEAEAAAATASAAAAAAAAKAAAATAEGGGETEEEVSEEEEAEAMLESALAVVQAALRVRANIDLLAEHAEIKVRLDAEPAARLDAERAVLLLRPAICVLDKVVNPREFLLTVVNPREFLLTYLQRSDRAATGFKGVYAQVKGSGQFSAEKYYEAQVTVKGKAMTIGRSDDAEEAEIERMVFNRDKNNKIKEDGVEI
ncbi:hypothetical protein T492DRAFT_832305 [Pavlovales sp. CCMP2436]|nr:hypothetical protein T492DRAFT_832305 [Pavlovales sp. CCMP2436]